MRIGDNSGKRGVQVLYNMTKLLASISAADLALSLVANELFANGDVITIGGEDITLVTASNACTITRGTNLTTPAAHGIGQRVLAATGTTILSGTFDGSTWFSGVWLSSETEAVFRITINDGTDKWMPFIYFSPQQLIDFLPYPRYVPENGTTYLVEAWVGQVAATCGASLNA